ncbi:glycosyltransferase family 4 protein [Streptomyces fructofermentans]|uniref:Glycosyl transferase family 1 n=1 Tax=Streptomyces fructofermentans TaxID=152141 RepID=A0A918NVL4_9ACTN|nr:glycosyltransferase family 4 protein [Streptomyces fructofermentans]GGX98547.1 glycosyl transferase family 1 [Streptomyces fructofermentans]
MKRLTVVARLHGYPPDHNAGAEWMTHSMLRALAARGHDVRVHLFRSSSFWGRYALQGVQVWPMNAAARTAGALGALADVVISHLEGVPFAKDAGARGGVPVISICHNTHGRTFEEASGVDLAVYNSQWMQTAANAFYDGSALEAPSRTLVVRPPVYAEDYRTVPGDRVTLINLNDNKGGGLFWELARRMPDVPFLGVHGSYGDQITGRLPNVEVLSHIPGSAMRERVYGRTRVLLAPSEYESWGRVAAEACASGIPVLAHPTPGLSECLGGAGTLLDRDDPDAWEKALRRLLAEPGVWEQASAAASRRSLELDPAEELEAWCAAVEEVAG